MGLIMDAAHVMFSLSEITIAILKLMSIAIA
jgi:hypothetical protein